MTIKLGDFSGLGENYDKHRPSYSDSILDMLIGLLKLPANDVSVADVGAGTGIWARMMHSREFSSVTAIEPNDDMRKFGELKEDDITWIKGSAENTGLSSESVDWVTMASSFHWTDPTKSLPEFKRILKKEGLFTALWNPRIIKGSHLLEEIENQILVIKPGIKRVSSGNSGITDNLTKIIIDSGCFYDVCYAEATHSIKMSPERYLGAWNSVNDLRHQLGEGGFLEFMEFVANRIKPYEFIETNYLTRSWTARVKK
jgi:SAM-dependent methyltransferase